MKQIRHNDTFYLEAGNGFEDWEIYYNLMARPAIEILQYETPMFHFFEYISRTITDVTAEQAFARMFVHSFKNGVEDDAIWAAELVSMYLRAHRLTGSEYTFISVPASTQERHEARYSLFMSEVCRRTGVINGYSTVNVLSSRKPVHEGGRRDLTNYTIDPSVAGRKVILFDDVCTTLQSWITCAATLESMGAEVIQGVFLAQASPLRRS